MVTEALEKFMAVSVANGAIVFAEPAAATEVVEREVRVLLTWLRKGRALLTHRLFKAQNFPQSQQNWNSN